MDTAQFLETILSKDGGYYCIFAANTSTNQRKQTFYSTVNDALTAAKQYDSKGFDTYFALGTFTNDNTREKVNIKHIKSFFLDLDCGENKPYATQKDALVALKTFCKELSLPTPLLVNSGRGIHVYWSLTEPVTFAEWEPVALRLKQVCKERGLEADPAVTADGARILRLPGTHNYKDKPPKPASVLGVGMPPPVDFTAFRDLLGSSSTAMVLPTTPIVGVSAMMDHLIGNTQGRFKTIMQKTLKGTGCMQLGIIARDQATVSEPQWRAGLSIANFCVDGEEAAHKISCNHPQYDPDETRAKMHRIQGPYLCTRFDEFNPGVCTKCKHWGKIKTPLLLGKEIIEASHDDNVVSIEKPNVVREPVQAPEGVVTIPAYPRPYFRGKNGGVYIRYTDKEGNQEESCIYMYDLYVVRRIRDPEVGESVVIRLHLPMDGMREFAVPLVAVTSKEELRKRIAAEGVISKNMGAIVEYLMDWASQLQATNMADEVRTQFGWTEGHHSFLVGDREIFADRVGVNQPSTATSQHMPMFKPKGTLDGWKNAISFFSRPGMELHQYMILHGFGSVLMEFIPSIPAAQTHVYSKSSGIGKTTALFACTSIWGNFNDLMIHSKDTSNFAMLRAEVYKNLPLCIDEVTNNEPKELSSMVLNISNGKQKGRMEASANKERTRGLTWSLMALSTGNTSITERISLYKYSAPAEGLRVLEIHANKFKFDDKLETDNFNMELSQHYGHAGAIFVQHLLRHPEETITLLHHVRAKVDKICNLSQEDRYWSANITVNLTALIIARKLGLLAFEVEPLFRFCKRAIDANRKALRTDEKTPKEIISEYVAENWLNVLHIHSSEVLGDSKRGHLMAPTREPRGDMVGRFETDRSILYVRVVPFREWCIRRQINFDNLVTTLIEDDPTITQRRYRVFKGTHLGRMDAVWCLIMPFKEIDDDDADE